MIKNKAGKEFLGDGQVLDLIYSLMSKTIKDCEIKKEFVDNRTADEIYQQFVFSITNLAENNGRLQFAKEVMKLLEDEEEALDD